MSYSTELVRFVWDDKDGVALRVGPDADSLGLVELRAADAKSEEYWGKVRLCMPRELALEVGRALIAAAGEAE